MALTRQKQVLDGLDELAGRGMRRAAQDYKQGVVTPLVDAIRGAKSPAGLLRALGPGLVRRMDTTGLAEQMTETMVQSALIGETSATPKEEMAKSE